MKYEYLTRRSIMPDGKKSFQLACCECGEPQISSYNTVDDQHICHSCRRKDEEGLLKFLKCEFGRDSCTHNKDGYCIHQETIDSGEDCFSFACWNNPLSK